MVLKGEQRICSHQEAVHVQRHACQRGQTWSRRASPCRMSRSSFSLCFVRASAASAESCASLRRASASSVCRRRLSSCHDRAHSSASGLNSSCFHQVCRLISSKYGTRTHGSMLHEGAKGMSKGSASATPWAVLARCQDAARMQEHNAAGRKMQRACKRAAVEVVRTCAAL